MLAWFTAPRNARLWDCVAWAMSSRSSEIYITVSVSLALDQTSFPHPCYPSGSVLREALEARSYKGEIILIANSLEKLGGITQLISNLEHLGYGHVLLLSYDRTNCEGLVKLLPVLGCVWSSFSFGNGKDVPEERFLLWFLRYKCLCMRPPTGLLIYIYICFSYQGIERWLELYVLATMFS